MTQKEIERAEVELEIEFCKLDAATAELNSQVARNQSRRECLVQKQAELNILRLQLRLES